MGVAVAKVFADEENAKAALAGKERVFKVGRGDETWFVSGKDANDVRVKMTKFWGVSVEVSGPAPAGGDAFLKRVQKMTPEEQQKLRELLREVQS